MIICCCNNVTSSDIAQALDQGYHTLEAIQLNTGAGTGCGVCVECIEELLYESS